MDPATTPKNWKSLVAAYQKSHTAKAMWQLLNSFIPLIITWYLMYYFLNVHYLITLLLAIPAAGFITRLFIIQHDCGHGSFLKSKKGNSIVGTFCSIFTFTPYRYWRKSHAIHHASAGNLEHRGIGDIYTMTIEEYTQRTTWGRFKYRLYRNPLILLTIVPFVLFVIYYRLPNYSSKDLRKEQLSVYMTNLFFFLLIGALIWGFGLMTFLMIQVPITILTSSLGMWLFYVQHQFDETYWAKNEEWDYTQAALKGSSYYKLPRVIQWFTGNIGFHHIHHLSPRIPNYMLEKCHKENPLFQNGSILTIKTSLRSLFLSLWDEKQKKLVSFKYFRNLQFQKSKF